MRLGLVRALLASWRTRAGLLVLGGFLLVAACGHLGWLPDPDASVGAAGEAPSASPAKWLGTDVLGRSVVHRVLAGARTAVTVGAAVLALAIPFGTVLGLLAGWYGRWVDAAVTWLYSVTVSIPDILLITAISYALGRGLESMCIALAATSWVGVMRLVRAEVLRHKSRDYVRAARAFGASDLRILGREILPNVQHVAIVVASLVLVSAIKGEVILTFLGLGVQDGASWGVLIAGATRDLVNDVWWPLLGTVAAMFALIQALSVVSDAMRDALDPRIA